MAARMADTPGPRPGSRHRVPRLSLLAAVREFYSRNFTTVISEPEWKSAPAQDESEALLPGFARDGCQTARQLKSTAGSEGRQ